MCLHIHRNAIKCDPIVQQLWSSLQKYTTKALLLCIILDSSEYLSLYIEYINILSKALKEGQIVITFGLNDFPRLDWKFETASSRRLDFGNIMTLL